ncbi:unnamed protein product [Phaeothamnion confervicola]
MFFYSLASRVFLSPPLAAFLSGVSCLPFSLSSFIAIFSAVGVLRPGESLVGQGLLHRWYQEVFLPKIQRRTRAMLETREQLRAAATARKMPRGTMGLAGRAATSRMCLMPELGIEAWASISEETIARCLFKAGILPSSLQAELAGSHGKAVHMPMLDSTFQQLGQMLRRLCLGGQQQPAEQLEREQSVVAEAILRYIPATLRSKAEAGPVWKIGTPLPGHCTPPFFLLAKNFLSTSALEESEESGEEEEEPDVEEVAGAAGAGLPRLLFDQGDEGALWRLRRVKLAFMAA